MDELKPQIAPTEFEEFRSVLRENELGSAMNVFDDRKGLKNLRLLLLRLFTNLGIQKQLQFVKNWNFFQQKYMKTSSIQKPSTSSSASLGTSQENTTSTASTALLSQESFGTKSAATSSDNSVPNVSSQESLEESTVSPTSSCMTPREESIKSKKHHKSKRTSKNSKKHSETKEFHDNIHTEDDEVSRDSQKFFLIQETQEIQAHIEKLQETSLIEGMQ
ncbi:hypothetical protein HHI36_005856 [Cryptolaemus montrouzieri]|uniref:Uncharacterized protein n=1 Tax=Cryptolaemus montrouzieri TaxID=559131 RepID=A0ABD2NVE9_9CUCU